MNKSIKQIVKSFSDFADIHKNISQYATQIVQQNRAANWKYPLMFTTLGSTTIQNGELRISMDVYFVDKGDEEDYVNKTSNMLKLAEDFMTYFSKNEQTFGFYLDDTATAEPIILAFEDSLIGYRLPIVVQVKSSENENELPL